MARMASLYFASPVLSEAAMKPVYKAAKVQSRLKSCFTRASCQSATFVMAFSTATRVNSGERSDANGRATSGASPTARRNSDGVSVKAKHAGQNLEPRNSSKICKLRSILFLKSILTLYSPSYSFLKGAAVDGFRILRDGNEIII